jgi:hypothetical protein
MVLFQVFMDVALCRWISEPRCFRGSCCLHLQGQAVLYILNILEFITLPLIAASVEICRSGSYSSVPSHCKLKLYYRVC